MLGGPGIIADTGDAESPHIFEIALLELAGQDSGRDILLRSSLYDLVVHIGDILKIEDAISPVLEIAGHHIEDDVGSGMTDMRIIINSGTAGE